MNDNLKLKKAKEKSIKTLIDVLEELDCDFNVSGNPFRPRHAELSIKADSLSNSITKAIYLIDKIEL